jgi:hypothetical protein
VAPALLTLVSFEGSIKGGQQADSISTARWDGPKLTIVTKMEMDGQVTESTQVWTVEGSTLTVETTNARGAQKRVYKKQLPERLQGSP